MTKTAWISVDMEGISGIVDREQLLPGSRLYEASCALMMDDLDAVLAGLSERNEVGRIVVNDSHDGMLNLPWSRFGRGVDQQPQEPLSPPASEGSPQRDIVGDPDYQDVSPVSRSQRWLHDGAHSRVNGGRLGYYLPV